MVVINSHLLSVLSDPKNEGYDDMIEWLGRKYDPNQFDPQNVWYDDPKERFKEMNEF